MLGVGEETGDFTVFAFLEIQRTPATIITKTINMVKTLFILTLSEKYHQVELMSSFLEI